MPLLSVILPVYNSERYLGDAIKSILAQTFTDFELIIINDRSTDGSLKVAESFDDKRIRIYTNEVNLGRAGSDNYGHQLATGTFFAKMDSDDICHPQRFEKQVSFLQNNPEVNVVGSNLQSFGASTYLNKFPNSTAKAKCFTVFGLPVANSASILRASLFNEKGLTYNAQLRQTEDYDFFARYINDLHIVNLQEALVDYRVFPEAQKKSILAERHTVANEVRKELLQQWGISFSDRELMVHNAIATSSTGGAEIELAECSGWLEKLLSYNETCTWFDKQALTEIVADKWFYSCYFSRGKRLSNWRAFYAQRLSRKRKTSTKETIKFLVKSIGSF